MTSLWLFIFTKKWKCTFKKKKAKKIWNFFFFCWRLKVHWRKNISKNILILGIGPKTYLRCYEGADDFFRKAENPVYLFILVNFYAPGSASIFPIRIRMQDGKINANLCGSRSTTLLMIQSTMKKGLRGNRQYCGTGTVGRVTFCRSGTEPYFNNGS